MSPEEDVDQTAKLACTVCRKRKQRCDRARPSCGTCDRLGHACQYEDRASEDKQQKKRKLPSTIQVEDLPSAGSTRQASASSDNLMSAIPALSTAASSSFGHDFARAFTPVKTMPDSLIAHLLDPQDCAVDESARPVPIVGFNTFVDYSSPAMLFYATHIYPFLQFASPASQRLEGNQLLFRAASLFTTPDGYASLRQDVEYALETQPTMAALQANILLSVFEYLSCRIMAFNLRCVANLRLCQIFQIVPKDALQLHECTVRSGVLRRPMTTSEMDERIRTYWAAFILCKLSDFRDTSIVLKRGNSTTTKPRPVAGLPDMCAQTEAWMMVNQSVTIAHCLSNALPLDASIDELYAELESRLQSEVDLHAKLVLLGAGVTLLDHLCYHMHHEKHTIKNPQAVMAAYTRQICELVTQQPIGFPALWLVYEACNHIAWQWAEIKDAGHFGIMNGLRGALEGYAMPIGERLARMADTYFASLVVTD